MYKATFPILFFLCSSFLLSAQTKADDKTDKSYFQLSFDYISNMVYMGRGDSLATPYFTPSISYYHKSGFYATFAAAYLKQGRADRIDYTTIGLGYDFDISEKLSGSLTLDKYFYDASSSAIRSDIRTDMGGSLTYDFNIIQVTGGANVLFDSKVDLVLNTNFAHGFEWGPSDKQWTLTPSIDFNFSTVNFFAGFAHRRLKTGNVLRMVTEPVDKGLLFLDNELTIPLTYEAKKWGWSLTPTYAVPQGTINTTTNYYAGTKLLRSTDSTPYNEIHHINPFYWEVEVHYNF